MSAADSIRLMPVSWSTMAGMRLFGLIFKNSGLNCSSLLVSTGCSVYGRCNSSRRVEALRPLGVVQVQGSITVLVPVLPLCRCLVFGILPAGATRHGLL